MKKIILILSLLIMTVFYTSCADKFDVTQFDYAYDNTSNIGDTVYIQQFPIWEGFNKPQDMIVGRETFLYIADTENDRVVMMNIAGEFLGAIEIKKPVAIAQDYRLNLIVCAEFDTTINGSPLKLGAVYKINLVDAGHQIGSANITRILPKSSFDYNKPNRKYTGVAVFSDNSFYVSRTGPENNNPIDPDNVILIFRKKTLTDGTKRDTLVGALPSFQPVGTGLMSAYNISSLTTFNNSSRDFIMTLTGDNSFKTQWLRYVETQDFTGYQSRLSAFSSDLMIVNKFMQPEDVALDNVGNIFVADAGKDSVFKFSTFGDELTSFGGSEIFDSPHAVAYYDKTLYVLDTNNDRILRFILSTEID
ncbi:MAG: hypothetical protein K9J16_10270 [Melioribacteraceae bacterium]|nr:hypothetical protein [Melioribacteraceae bacterium]MCF8353398.1 hypothetical protein [Melioribacteraceae bacterium]MCF8393023.1 hypothetical protein [Melioribacteraceae bacterium]MCF8419124.1 hypothetical protein [Melioribacteraceae bacterium]